MSNLVATYHQLLLTSYQTAKAVDYFDLHSHDPSSSSEFKRLCQEDNDAQLALIGFINHNYDALIVSFDKVS